MEEVFGMSSLDQRIHRLVAEQAKKNHVKILSISEDFAVWFEVEGHELSDQAVADWITVFIQKTMRIIEKTGKKPEIRNLGHGKRISAKKFFANFQNIA